MSGYSVAATQKRKPALRFSVLPKDTMADRGRAAFELPTFRSLENPIDTIDCTGMVLFLLGLVPDVPPTPPWVQLQGHQPGTAAWNFSLSLTPERLLVVEHWQGRLPATPCS